MSVPGLLYPLVERARELLGPVGIMGNHVVIRRHDGACVALAHVQRGSVRVERAGRVEIGDVAAGVR